MEKQIAIIGLGSMGRSVALEMEIMRLKDAGINIVEVGDNFQKKENKMVDDFIEQMSYIQPLDRFGEIAMIGNFTEDQTKKAIAKKEWKHMTYEERKKLRP